MRTLVVLCLLAGATLAPFAAADIGIWECNTAGTECFESGSIPAPVDCTVYVPHPGVNHGSHCDGVGLP